MNNSYIEENEPVWKNPFVNDLPMSTSRLPPFSYCSNDNQYDHLYCRASKEKDDDEINSIGELNYFENIFKQPEMLQSVIYTKNRLKYIREEGDLNFDEDNLQES
jgi:hypothetical protein